MFDPRNLDTEKRCRHQVQTDFVVCDPCEAESENSLRRMLHEIDGPVYSPEHRLETVSKELMKTRIHLARLENLQGLLANDLAILNSVTRCSGCEAGVNGTPYHHICD
jgi:hypothetical protein